ncbi:MAG: ABC transporter permease [Firmicutes bacterium]|nr:ABC transporter permease [Bacillota bacterium]
MADVTRGYHVHITSDHDFFKLGLREVWRYRDLIWLFTQKNFKLVYKQTILGPMWLIMNPLITSLIYTVVFGGIAGLSTAGVPRLLFYLSSHAMWTFFASCLRNNASTFLTNSHIFQKVYFPRLTMPFSTVLTAFLEFAIQMVLVGAMLAVYAVRGEVSPDWAMMPLLIPVLLLTGALGLGLGILISSATTKYRDLNLLVGFGLQLWMYMSPVVYPVSQIPLEGPYQYLIQLNPMTAPLELFRLVLLGTGSVTPVSVISTLVFAAVSMLSGIMVFNKVERNFIDTV